jgi:hypothetical protein
MHPDVRNEEAEEIQAVLFARNTFVVTMVGAVAFVAVSLVYVFA